MNKQIEALKMAIEALEKAQHYMQCDMGIDTIDTALDSCKEAIAEAEEKEIGEAEIRQMLKEIEWCHQELAKKEWQSLSDDELRIIQDNSWIIHYDGSKAFNTFIFARAIEQALKEKNHA